MIIIPYSCIYLQKNVIGHLGIFLLMSQPFLVLSVSQLNRQVKSYLENEIGLIHVEGEVSNLSKPSSGHFYFTLKDNNAQLRCVFFKNRHLGPISSKLVMVKK